MLTGKGVEIVLSNKGFSRFTHGSDVPCGEMELRSRRAGTYPHTHTKLMHNFALKNGINNAVNFLPGHSTAWQLLNLHLATFSWFFAKKFR